jgi:hypothetical protein
MADEYVVIQEAAKFSVQKQERTISVPGVRSRNKGLKMCGLSYHKITSDQPLTNKYDSFEPASKRAGSYSTLFLIKM